MEFPSSNMELEPKPIPEQLPETLDFAEDPEREPLELLPVREGTVQLEQPRNTCLPVAVSDARSEDLEGDRWGVEEIKFALKNITDEELQPARVYVGLTFIGFSALLLMSLLFYIKAMHPGLTFEQEMLRYWHQYIGFVCLGVAGMMMVGREAMRGDRNMEENTRSQK
ncbi:hypothetical protein [Phormidium sp. CCY1219]|uniref:hypothetical protein n=1 Tax=Phormidium sp. CCY1219 TaxID=2886104 RepID=UPI002D1E5CD4|nr:hypothetical protein [Phormidium sp. CCY1219]MEB3829854.1 manganese efflux pump MntP family protein [Phormidium sp. CCY1219]